MLFESVIYLNIQGTNITGYNPHFYPKVCYSYLDSAMQDMTVKCNIMKYIAVL